MLPTVDLDNKETFHANEIDDVVSDQVLALEFVAAQVTITHPPPKLVFGQRGLVAHAACASPIYRTRFSEFPGCCSNQCFPLPLPSPPKKGGGEFYFGSCALLRQKQKLLLRHP